MAEKPAKMNKLKIDPAHHHQSTPKDSSPSKSHHFDPFDPHNPFILSHLSRMADIHMSQKNYKAGVPLLEAIFEGQKKDPSLGPTHPTTMQSELRYLNAKFYLVYDNGRGAVGEAIKIFEDSYQLQNKLRMMAARESPALKLSEEELEALEQLHWARINGFHCIILVKEGKVGEAYELYKSVFHTFYSYLGGDNPETVHAFKMAEILARKYDHFEEEAAATAASRDKSETPSQVKNEFKEPPQNLTTTTSQNDGSQLTDHQQKDDQKFERPPATSSPPNPKMATATVKKQESKLAAQSPAHCGPPEVSSRPSKSSQDMREKFLQGDHDDRKVVIESSQNPMPVVTKNDKQNFEPPAPVTATEAAGSRKSSQNGPAENSSQTKDGREAKDHKKNKNCVIV